MANVLLVDDQQDMLDLVEFVFGEEKEHTLLTTTSPHEALSIVQRDKPSIDLVVADQIMPEMLGSELLEKTYDWGKAQNPQRTIKGVLSTGYTVEKELAYLRGRGMEVSYLKKPYVPTELLNAVQTLVRK